MNDVQKEREYWDEIIAECATSLIEARQKQNELLIKYDALSHSHNGTIAQNNIFVEYATQNDARVDGTNNPYEINEQVLSISLQKLHESIMAAEEDVRSLQEYYDYYVVRKNDDIDTLEGIAQEAECYDRRSDFVSGKRDEKKASKKKRQSKRRNFFGS